MKTKLVLSFLAYASFAVGQINAQTIEVTSTGVGIGTTTPSAKLEVGPGAVDTHTVRIQGSSSASYSYGLLILAGSNSTDNGLSVGPFDGSRCDFIVKGSGNVGIGTASPSYKLHVSGSVRATSFIADVNTYADFVFKPDYKLASLADVESSINANGHLPDIPSEAEVKRDGIDVVQMQTKLLQKVEELTLHLIGHEKKLQQLRSENETLQRKLSELEKR